MAKKTIKRTQKRLLEDLKPTTTIKLSAGQWKDFMAIMEKPPKPNRRLANLMRRHIVWE